MWDALVFFYSYFVFFYAIALMISYVFLIVQAYRFARNYSRWTSDYLHNMINKSPFTPGVSIVAPAFNEEVTVMDNVMSLMKQDYPKFEIVIVNDGSKDNTLEVLIDKFNLIEVPYNYIYRVHCRPFRHLYKSTNPLYDKLVVVDKENGGTKADAVNGGLNVAKYPYFVNTDVDCILSRDAIYECILPVLLNRDIIAVSGIMSMSNGFVFDEKGEVTEYRTSNNPWPLFQDLEYKRSFLIGKMGWSQINAMPNVSGGYGLFSTQVVIASGGYGFDSFAEDMDMLTRMITYCCDFNREYRVVQIPHTCCWTEGPNTWLMLRRQRIRWGRGLIQLITNHKRIILNKKYRRLGLITYPYIFFFEFLAPLVEVLGYFMLIYLIFTGGVNWDTFWIMFFAIYSFSIMLSSFVVFYDYIQGGSYNKSRNYLKLVIAAIVEPFIYHPFISFFSLNGYWQFITKQHAVWKSIERKGVKSAGDASPKPQRQTKKSNQPPDIAPALTA